jgi:polyphosphate kinase 2 (PPK2 family)
VVRVHQKILEAQRLPPEVVTRNIWKERLRDIANFEDYLGRQGVVILKFFLHVSREEQKRRFLDRLNDPRKNWKFSPADVEERRYWNDYMDCFEEAIRATASPAAPWYVVPADNKWFTHLVVAAAIVGTLARLNLSYPAADAAKLKDLKRARAMLKRERP